MSRMITFLLTAAVFLAGCSLPSDESAQLISPNQLPDVLRSDVTITTTTLEEVPRTVALTVYFLGAQDDRNVVIPVTREVDPSAGLFDRLGLLFADEARSPEEVELGLANAVGEFTLTSAETNANNIAIIDVVVTDIDGNVIPPENEVLKNAAAQIVWTVMGFQQIDGVRLRYDGGNVLLPTSEGDTDAVVTLVDYVRYDPKFVAPATTLPDPSTTSATATSEAPTADG